MSRQKTQPVANSPRSRQPSGADLRALPMQSIVIVTGQIGRGERPFFPPRPAARQPRPACCCGGIRRMLDVCVCVWGWDGGFFLAGINNSFSGRPKQAAGVLCGLT